MAKSKKSNKANRTPSEIQNLEAQTVELQSQDGKRLFIDLYPSEQGARLFLNSRVKMSFNCEKTTEMIWDCVNDCQMGQIILTFPEGDFSKARLSPYTLTYHNCDPNVNPYARDEVYKSEKPIDFTKKKK